MKLFTTTLATVLAIFLLATGCQREETSLPNEIVIEAGGDQAAPLGAVCKKELMIQVLGQRELGMLGGAGSKPPVPNVKVTFSSSSAAGDPKVEGPAEVMADSGGIVKVKVRLGNRFGDQYLKIKVDGGEEPVTKTVRFIGGVEMLGNKQEMVAGTELDSPFGVKITGQDGAPMVGVPVYFNLKSQPGKKGKLTVQNKVTDADGLAFAQLESDPWETGSYKIVAEVSDPERDLYARGMEFKQMAICRSGLAITVLGALGIFILGMTFMSEGLQRIAGNRLKGILHFLTGNRFSAVFAGTMITAVIQSSSATTVMVVGFVNAGLLQLKQAIGLVFGANIGTTITGQMVSFKLDGMALPAIAVGVAVYMIARRTMLRSAAQGLFGFGLLFLGMTMMSHELKTINDFPSFIQFFSMFDCQPDTSGTMPFLHVLGAIGIGTALTIVVQSSSATVGLTIALASSGLLNFYTAVPIILGDNIGTTITALLASIGTNRTARQAAIAHTMFNVLGMAYVTALFYVPFRGEPAFLWLVNHVTAGDVFGPLQENIGRHVANAHTIFNIVNVIIFLPFISSIAWVCQKLVPMSKETRDSFKRLEPHLLDTPPLALEQSISALVTMTEKASRLVDDCYACVMKGKIDDREALAKREARIDAMQLEISGYLVQLTQRELDEQQAQTVPLLIHCVNDAERMGDHAENLLDLATRMKEGEMHFSTVAQKELDEMMGMIRRLSARVDASLRSGDPSAAKDALKLEGEINQLTEQAHENHVLRLGANQCKIEAGIYFVELVNNLERVADHLSNIAERAATLETHRLHWRLTDTGGYSEE